MTVSEADSSTSLREQRGWEQLLPILVYIQANLAEDLSLATLAARAGSSPSHFHRLFRSLLGETLKSYTERLRLESAAMRLLMHRTSVLQVALDCGFRTAETFSRAFRRVFETSPSEYRKAGVLRGSGVQQRRPAVEEEAPAFELSTTRVVELSPQHLAFRRHVGPYEDVPVVLFDEVADFVVDQRLDDGIALLGIGWDAPGLTPPEKLRFDAAVRVSRPFSPRGEIGHQEFPGGSFAVTRHVGPFATLALAYRELAARLSAMRGWRPLGGPAVEMYRSTHLAPRLDAEARINHTDIYLPVEKD